MLGAFLQADLAKTEKRACFELRQTPKPVLTQDPPPGTVLIRTVAASICGSDFSGKGPRHEVWRGPLDYLEALVGKDLIGGTGHELLGEIVQVVEPCQYPIGQHVLAFSTVYLKLVLAEEFRRKSGNVDLSVFENQGGFAEYFVSHESVCLPIPTTFDKFDPRWFVLAQPLGTVLHACQYLDNLMGKTVAIVGQGQNGLIMAQLLAGYRPKRLIVLDLLANRLEFSKQHYGVTHTIHVQRNESMIADTKLKLQEITNGELCDVVVDMVGHQNTTVNLCAQLTKAPGTVLLFGIPPAREEPQFTIQSADFARNLKYQTAHSPPLETFQWAIEPLLEGRFDPRGLFSHTISFDNFPAAYDMAQNYQDGVIKVLVTFEGRSENQK